MKKNNLIHFIEYLSPTLILSYFLVHNIYLVLIGIIFSFYLININFNNSIIRSLNKYIFIKNVSGELNKNYQATKYNSKNIMSTKEDNIPRFIKTIEEIRFIPSLDKINN